MSRDLAMVNAAEAYTYTYTYTYLATSVGQSQDIGLPEIAMGWHYDNIEDHGYPAQKPLQSVRIGCLQEVEEETYHL